MALTLDAVEVRVLGSLLEKDLATPEYYPLTVNALVNACNQKTNRDPVVNYDERTVEEALERLREKRLAAMITGAGIRVPKHRHLLGDNLNLGRRELALLCTLMLRGRQTAGELRDRTERMHAFGDVEEVEAVLERLIAGDPEPLAVRLPRQPGTKEPRYAHLLSGPVEAETVPGSAPAPVGSPPASDRYAELANEVATLREEIASLRAQLAEFRKQFE